MVTDGTDVSVVGGLVVVGVWDSLLDLVFMIARKLLWLLLEGLEGRIIPLVACWHGFNDLY